METYRRWRELVTTTPSAPSGRRYFKIFGSIFNTADSFFKPANQIGSRIHLNDSPFPGVAMPSGDGKFAFISNPFGVLLC